MEHLKKLREKKGLLQKDVAAVLGVDRTTYVKYERGDSDPGKENIVKLANFFNVSTDYILENTDEPTPVDSVVSLDQQLSGLDFALYGETKDLTDEEKEKIIEFIKFTKSQRK